MLEYAFFNPEPSERFVKFLLSRGLKSEVRCGDPETLVCLEEDGVSDSMADEIDKFYDEMFALDQAQYNQGVNRSTENYDAAGVVVNLRDGRAVYADVKPALLSRVMEALAPEELGELVDAIVAAVEHPDERSFCERMREAAKE